MLENLTKLGKFEEVYIPGRLHTALVENYHEDFIIKNYPTSLSSPLATIVNEESHHSRLFSAYPNYLYSIPCTQRLSQTKLIQYGKLTHANMFNDALNINLTVV